MTTKEENQIEIAKLLAPFVLGTNEEVGTLLTFSVGRILMKNPEFMDKSNIQVKIKHITDWLHAAVINNEAWLSNLDDQRRPKKLMKFASIDQIVQEADKAMVINSQKSINIELIEEDEEFHTQLSDKYYLVRLLTPEALDRESSYMQHCIGGGAYDEKVENGIYQYLSLRDRSNKPHVTIEIEDSNIIQIQGKQNSLPNDKYMDVLIPYFSKHNLHSSLGASILKHVIDEKGDWYKIDEIPDNTTFSSYINLSDMDLKKLPDNMVVKYGCSLNISDNPIDQLPENLKIQGALNLMHTNITVLPENLKVNKILNISNTKIKKIPASIKSLYMLEAANSHLHAVPEGLIIKYKLILDHTYKLKKLPENLHLQNDLSLVKSFLKELPEGLKVGGKLNLFYSEVLEIPSDIEIGGELDISGTRIRKLPDNLKNFYQIIATESKLEEITDNLTIKKDLTLARTSMKVLPKGLTVGSVLNIKYTKICELPEDLKVGQGIIIHENQINHVPDSILESNVKFYLPNRSLSAQEYQDTINSSQPRII